MHAQRRCSSGSTTNETPTVGRSAACFLRSPVPRAAHTKAVQVGGNRSEFKTWAQKTILTPRRSGPDAAAAHGQQGLGPWLEGVGGAASQYNVLRVRNKIVPLISPNYLKTEAGRCQMHNVRDHVPHPALSDRPCYTWYFLACCSMLAQGNPAKSRRRRNMNTRPPSLLPPLECINSYPADGTWNPALTYPPKNESNGGCLSRDAQDSGAEPWPRFAQPSVSASHPAKRRDGSMIGTDRSGMFPLSRSSRCSASLSRARHAVCCTPSMARMSNHAASCPPTERACPHLRLRDHLVCLQMIFGSGRSICWRPGLHLQHARVVLMSTCGRHRQSRSRCGLHHAGLCPPCRARDRHRWHRRSVYLYKCPTAMAQVSDKKQAVTGCWEPHCWWGVTIRGNARDCY